MKVLITGGAGFIGSHLTRALLASGHPVTLIDALSPGSLDNITSFQSDPHYRFIKGDFRECPYYQFGDEYQIVRKQI